VIKSSWIARLVYLSFAALLVSACVQPGTSVGGNVVNNSPNAAGASPDYERCSAFLSLSADEIGLTGYETEVAVQGLRNFATEIQMNLGGAEDSFLRIAAANVVELTRDAADVYQMNDGLGNNQIEELTDGWVTLVSRCTDLVERRESNLEVPDRALSQEIDVRYVAPYEIRVGDCLREESDRLNFNASKGTNRTVAITDCINRHDSEFYAGTALEGSSFPGDDYISDFSIDFCLSEFDTFVGKVFEESTLNAYYLSPSLEEWNLGNKSVLCGIYDPTGPVQGSLQAANR